MHYCNCLVVEVTDIGIVMKDAVRVVVAGHHEVAML
jgi:hypothetical protein